LILIGDYFLVRIVWIVKLDWHIPGASRVCREDIKLQRQKFHKDIVPDHRKNELNKEFVDIYGEKRTKELGYSDKEIKHAKYVYQEEGYYKK